MADPIRYDEMGKAYYCMSEDIAAWWLGDTGPVVEGKDDRG